LSTYIMIIWIVWVKCVDFSAHWIIASSRRFNLWFSFVKKQNDYNSSCDEKHYGWNANCNHSFAKWRFSYRTSWLICWDRIFYRCCCGRPCCGWWSRCGRGCGRATGCGWKKYLFLKWIRFRPQCYSGIVFRKMSEFLDSDYLITTKMTYLCKYFFFLNFVLNFGHFICNNYGGKRIFGENFIP